MSVSELAVQGLAELPFLGCENYSGKYRQMWWAIAGRKWDEKGASYLFMSAVSQTILEVKEELSPRKVGLPPHSLVLLAHRPDPLPPLLVQLLPLPHPTSCTKRQNGPWNRSCNMVFVSSPCLPWQHCTWKQGRYISWNLQSLSHSSFCILVFLRDCSRSVGMWLSAPRRAMEISRVDKMRCLIPMFGKNLSSFSC